MKTPTPKSQGRDKIQNVCAECGISANVLTCIKKYGDRPKKLCFTLSTYHMGKCDWCGEKKHVTEARDFFYPDFSLLPPRVVKKPKKTK